MTKQMLQEAKSVLDVLTNNGYQAYFVGGWVRDRVAGREGKDIDIATSATPEEVVRLFPRTAPTGLQHGTVTVICAKHTFEVTTFRTESQYERFRRPKEVRFVDDLREDLQRRDFTMNAMAMDREERLIDPFGGQQDLRDGVLRCVGDPRERFAEDALRMLRCIRFAAEYGLTVEPRTWQALLAEREKLAHIAMERVRSEWERMIAGSDPGRALRLLFDSGLLGALKAPLGLPCARWSAADMPPGLSRIGEVADPAARWALLLLAQGASADAARAALSRLTFARAAAADIVAVVACDARLRAALRELAAAQLAGGADRAAEHAGAPSAASAALGALARSVKRAALRCGGAAVRRWLAIAPLLPPAVPAQPGRDAPPSDADDGAPEAAGAASGAGAADTERRLYALLLRYGAAWLAEMPAERLSQLAVDGRDVARAVGRAPGPWLGRLLDRLLVDVACGDIANDKDRLLERAHQYDRKWNEHE